MVGHDILYCICMGLQKLLINTCRGNLTRSGVWLLRRSNLTPQPRLRFHYSLHPSIPHWNYIPLLPIGISKHSQSLCCPASRPPTTLHLPLLNDGGLCYRRSRRAHFIHGPKKAHEREILLQFFSAWGYYRCISVIFLP